MFFERLMSDEDVIIERLMDSEASVNMTKAVLKGSAILRHKIFDIILLRVYTLMHHKNANYVVQAFFDIGTVGQKNQLLQKIQDYVLQMSLHVHGCKVIQKALESISPEQKLQIANALEGHVTECVENKNGSNVIQKCIEQMDANSIQFIIQPIINDVRTLFVHEYGCGVVRSILKHCTGQYTAPILDQLYRNADKLVMNKFGNYLIQHELVYGRPENKSQLINIIIEKFLWLSQNQFAKDMLHDCIKHATQDERALLIEKVCSFDDSDILVMMTDEYFPSVLLEMLKKSKPEQLEKLICKIKPYLKSVRTKSFANEMEKQINRMYSVQEIIVLYMDFCLVYICLNIVYFILN